MGIATLGVLRIDDGDAVPLTGPVVEDPEIVPVEMHGVGVGVIVPDVDTDGGVGAEVYDVPFGVVGVGVVFLLGEEQDWVVVVAVEGYFVHVECAGAGGVDDVVYGDVIGYAGGGEGFGVIGDGHVECVLELC